MQAACCSASSRRGCRLSRISWGGNWNLDRTLLRHAVGLAWKGYKSRRDRSAGKISCTRDGQRAMWLCLGRACLCGGHRTVTRRPSSAMCHDKSGGDSDPALFNHRLTSLGPNEVHMIVWSCHILQSSLPLPTCGGHLFPRLGFRLTEGLYSTKNSTWSGALLNWDTDHGYHVSNQPRRMWAATSATSYAERECHVST